MFKPMIRSIKHGQIISQNIIDNKNANACESVFSLLVLYKKHNVVIAIFFYQKQDLPLQALIKLKILKSNLFFDSNCFILNRSDFVHVLLSSNWL